MNTMILNSILLMVIRSQKYFQNSGDTMNRSFTGTGMLASSTWSKTCFGADSSSSRNVYLNCKVSMVGIALLG